MRLVQSLHSHVRKRELAANSWKLIYPGKQLLKSIPPERRRQLQVHLTQRLKFVKVLGALETALSRESVAANRPGPANVSCLGRGRFLR